MGTVLRELGQGLHGAWRRLSCAWRAYIWLALVVSLLALVGGGVRAASWTLFGFWVAANALVGMYALVWSLLRPQVWRMMMSLAFGWSFAGAFLTAILTPVWVAKSAAMTGEVSLGSPLLLLIAGTVFGTALVLGFFVSIVGASLGVIGAGACTEHSAQWGLLACWGWQGVGLLIAIMGAPPIIVLSLWLGMPLLTWGTARLFAPGSPFDNQLLAVRSRLRRALRLQGRWGTRRWQVDLRGAALGATVALSTWLIWQTGMLQPLQANSLIWLIQFRNEPWVLERRGTRLELGQGEAPSQVVLLSHDQAGYEAVHRSSECAVLAQAIRRLHGGGAQLVLAPVPLLDVSAEQPEPIRQLVQRNRRDLPLLQTAARAGKVVWVAPPMERLPPEAQALLREGKAVGSMDRIRYFAPGLPVFERGGNRESPALAAVQSLGTRPQDTQRQRLLITDFYGEQPGEAFTRVPLGAVLTGKPFYLVGAHHTVREEFLLQQQRVPPRLVPPQQLLKGNIVILPFWGPDTYATPIGRMDPQELIAHQLASLLRGDTIRMPPPGWVLGVLMVLGMVSGHLCLRRAPVQAWWTAVLIALLVWLSSIGLFLVARLWFDPLLSVLSVAGTALLVSQLTFASESAERARQRALLQRLVAPEVAEQLLEDFETRLQAGGMRSQIAVLFADIRHFTRFAETHTPEQVIERLNRLLGVLTETLHAHRGILDKYTGDGLMAIFAVHLLPQPESEEQLICRVVRAAIAMQHALQSVEPAGDSALGMGIGIHFGEAVLGLLGSHAQFNYTAVGRTVVIAARLQALAAAGEIVLSEPVYEVARAAGIVPDLPPETVQLKGMSAPCVVYRLHVPDKASEPSPSVLHAEERVKL